ncbi:hypothetical protein ACYA6O_20465 [Klebsiella pneumoniae]|uniref:hypothetical protein n=1 Tax=Klebsiella TaxID=570 RepID=UPI000E2BC435|nr:MULTISPECIES: hypothetical protein [Klebsiella]MBZ2036137.1 hypothetical protein [Klebsiella pneumoniae]SXF09247.1 Uncharacterised protein [Klebsiella variicola]HBR4918392.1 hypothetical protein [Klebsiella pneumoniae]HCB9346885.1 hypothetical protein [Klebsiella pneumoniae]
MKCYYQGCSEKGVTKEHIPPKSFFPKDEKSQLLTVRSCVKHNNLKSKDDLYVLAQICMNASPSNRAREIFFKKVSPQLDFNNGALRKKLAAGSVPMPDGSVKYPVDITRLNDFFTALSCGVVFKTCGISLPSNYSINHVYCNLTNERESLIDNFEKELEKFYSEPPLEILNFGKPNTQNETIYTVELFGIPNFGSSITIVHVFFGKFKVISMLTKKTTT